MTTQQFLRVRRSGPLRGTFRVPGAKNCTIKLIPATVLATGEFVLRNVPDILDVRWSCEVLQAMGASVRRPDPNTIEISSCDDIATDTPYELVSKMRASVIGLGPLLARFGEASVALPGGDDFGSRPIDMHLAGLTAMGAEFRIEHGVVHGRVDGRLEGAEIFLDYPSVGATEHLMMSATLAKGRTVIHNAAQEPEIVDEAAFLRAMGADVTGAGTSTITVEGVDSLHAVDFTVAGDRTVAATAMAATLAAHGEVMIDGVDHRFVERFAQALGRAGATVAPTTSGVSMVVDGRPSGIDVASLPYPGVATDYIPMLVAALSVAAGTSIITENIYPSRLAYVDELTRLSADVRSAGHHIVVRGVERLSGAPVRAGDIRAGAALAVAGLVAHGETVVSGGHHIARGYEDLARDLRAIGADAEWVTGDEPEDQPVP